MVVSMDTCAQCFTEGGLSAGHYLEEWLDFYPGGRAVSEIKTQVSMKAGRGG